MNLASRFPELFSLDPDGRVVDRFRRAPVQPALFHLLTDPESRLDAYRAQLNDCIDLAKRHGVLSRDRKARLTSLDPIPFYSEWNELKVALFFEHADFTMNFWPQAEQNRVAEFLITRARCTVFVEVKTVFDNEELSRWNSTSRAIRRALSRVEGPYFVFADVVQQARAGSLSQKRLRKFVMERIREIGEPREQSSDAEFTYSDDSGYQLLLRLIPNPGTSHVVAGASIAGPLDDRERLGRSLKKAQRPLNSTLPCLVILCGQSAAIGPDDLENVLYGGGKVHANFGLYARCSDGLWGTLAHQRARRLSAVGFYWEEFNASLVPQLRVYHCPWARPKVPVETLRHEGIVQFALANDGLNIVEMR